jgi:hypothetical protein
MLKPNQNHVNSMQFAIELLSNPQITAQDLKKAISVVGTVIVSLDGRNLDYLEWYEIVGKGGVNVRQDLLRKATSIYAIIRTSL